MNRRRIKRVINCPPGTVSCGTGCCSESGVGIDLDPLESMAKEIAGKLVKAIEPEIGRLAAQASEAAQPTISKIVREDVLPKTSLAILAGMAAAGAVGAIVASLIVKGRRK